MDMNDVMYRLPRPSVEHDQGCKVAILKAKEARTMTPEKLVLGKQMQNWVVKQGGGRPSEGGYSRLPRGCS